MGVMTFMRTKMGYFLVGGIALVLALFVLEPLLQQGSAFWGGSRTAVGVIDGEEVQHAQFNQKVEQAVAQYGANNPSVQAMAVDQAWQMQIAEVVLTKEYERLGLIVSGSELYDLITGDRPSPLIVQAFTNQQTGEVDKTSIISSLKARETNPELKARWIGLEAQIEQTALQQKYDRLVKNSIYVTSLEANDDYTNRNKLANLNYVSLDYSSILDGAVKLTDADYQAYYDAHKSSFINPTETRNFEYVSFSIKPTAADSAVVKAQVDKLAADFKVTTNDSLFAANNSDVKVPFVFLGKGKLDPAVDSVIFNYPAGSFYGPVFSGNSYKLIKVVASRFSPDSVKASHILLDPTKYGGEEKALKLADSIKNLAKNGTSFGELATKYSADQSSVAKAGDLGTFDRYSNLPPEFISATFDGTVGDVKVVKSQYGIQIVKIDKHVGSSKVAKLAYIEKSLSASSKTRDVAYKQASAFLSEVKNGNFTEVAKKKGYTVGVADRVTPTQGFAPGLENPRKLIQSGYEADKGDVLQEVFTMDNAYVVAQVTDVMPKGQLSLDNIKKQIQPMVMNAAKAKQLREKLEKALSGSSNIAQVAQKVGKTVTPVENIVFANPILPGLGQENKVVGAIFGSQVGKLSKPIEGDKGVFVFVVNGFTNPAPMNNTYKQKETMLLGVSQRAFTSAFQTLQDKVEIKDNRVKFY